MNGDLRRNLILERLNEAEKALSASFLAGELGVSRQVVVGDIALLRAAGHEIASMARGYSIPKFTSRNSFLSKVVCLHDAAAMRGELSAIVELEAEVLDVIIEHEIYGEITGSLNIKTKQDIDKFLQSLEEGRVRPLSDLTAGLHSHTIACRDKMHFDEIVAALKKLDVLYEN